MTLRFKRWRFAGFEISILTYANGANFSFAVKNRFWEWIHAWLIEAPIAAARRTVAAITGREPPPSIPALPIPPPPPPENPTPEQKRLLAAIKGIEWYHSIDLGAGIKTPGFFDHSTVKEDYGVPARLDGMRVLDVATHDGFWAFEFERRGAREVVAIDIDKVGDYDYQPFVRASIPPERLAEPLGGGFRVAKELLGSKVERVALNVYDLSPERLGTFDMVFCGDVLLHLKNPVEALQNIRSVTRGFALIAECYLPLLDRFAPFHAAQYLGGWQSCHWWYFGVDTLERMVWDAGFLDVKKVRDGRLGIRGVDEVFYHAVFRASTSPP